MLLRRIRRTQAVAKEQLEESHEQHRATEEDLIGIFGPSSSEWPGPTCVPPSMPATPPGRTRAKQLRTLVPGDRLHTRDHEPSQPLAGRRIEVTDAIELAEEDVAAEADDVGQDAFLAWAMVIEPGLRQSDLAGDVMHGHDRVIPRAEQAGRGIDNPVPRVGRPF